MVTDRELLQRWVRGHEQEAFGELVRRHVGMVHGIAKRMLGGPGREAEDVVQGVFWLLAQRAGRLGGVKAEKLGGWLYRVTVYCCRSVRKAEGRRKKREREVGMLRAEAVAEETREGLRGMLDEGMMRLSERERRAVVARYLEGKSAEETGVELGISAGTAEKRARRGVERLRRFFGRRGLSVGAAAVVGVMGADAAHAAPASVVEAAMRAGGGTVSSTSVALAKGAAMAIVRATVLRAGIAAGVLVMAGVAVEGQTGAAAEPAAKAKAPSTAPLRVFMGGIRPDDSPPGGTATPAADLKENPAYAAWAKHAVGTVATWKQIGGAGGGLVTAELLEVLENGVMLRMAGAGQRSGPVRMLLPAKSVGGQPVMPLPAFWIGKLPKEWTEGEETVTAAGRELKAKTREGKVQKDGAETRLKEWTSVDVPGAMVKQEVTTKDVQGGENVTGWELASVEEGTGTPRNPAEK